MRAGDFERDGETGLLLPRGRHRGGPRVHPQYVGPAFFASAAGGGGGGGAHRYWRLSSFTTSGTFVELSKIELFAGSTSYLTTPAQTISASSALSSGTVADWQDSNLGTRAYITASTAEAGGWSVNWDLGSAKPIVGFVQGGYDTSDRYIAGATLQYSDDNSSWTTQASVSGLSYPGNNTISSLISMVGGGATSHRYWRLTSFDIPGSFLEISELILISGPIPSASAAAASGSLYGLYDLSLSTRGAWNKPITFTYDFGSGVTVAIDGVKLGAFDNSSNYPTAFTLESSDNGSTWATAGSASGLSYPGNNTLSALITPT